MSKASRPGLFSTLKDDVLASVFEFVGTTFWLTLGLGGIQTAYALSGDSRNSIGHVFFVSASMGLSLIAAAWIFFRGTGGLFNPNVSLALVLVGAIGPVRFVMYCIAQILGAIAAAGLVRGLLPQALDVDTYLSNGTSRTRGVFIEMFITAALALAVLSLSAEKHRTPYGHGSGATNGSDTTGYADNQGLVGGRSTLGHGHGGRHGANGSSNNGSSSSTPVALGLTVFAAHLFAYLWTGASMNTARSFGPAVVNRFSRDYHNRHWVYWLGPFLGSLLAAALYTIMKKFNYWSLTPDQSVNGYTNSPPGAVGAVKGMMGSHNPNAVDGTHGATDRHGTAFNNNNTTTTDGYPTTRTNNVV